MSDSPLFRLVYVSRNKIEGDAATVENEIAKILMSARKNNEKNNITGALLFSSGIFAQILEGPQEEVESLFETIQEDERHEDCMVLVCDPAERRQFSQWSMAYRGTDTQAKQRFADLVDNQFDVMEEMAGNRIFSLIVDHIDEASLNPPKTG